MKEVIESTNLEKQLTRHHEGDSDYTHQGTGSSKKVLIASVCLTLGYAVIEVIGGFLSNSLALLSDAHYFNGLIKRAPNQQTKQCKVHRNRDDKLICTFFSSIILHGFTYLFLNWVGH